MRPKTQFTVKGLDALSPESKPYTINDVTVPGLRCRVWPSGKKVLEVRRRVGPRVVTAKICNAGDLPLNGPVGVRQRARELLAEMTAGHDPNATKRADQAQQEAMAYSLGQALSDYQGEMTLKPKTAYEYAGSCQRYFKDWLSRPLAGLTVLDIQRRHREIAKTAGGYSANGAMRVLRLLTRFAHRRFRDPVTRQSPIPDWASDALEGRWQKEKRRQRIIEPMDLKAWWSGLESLPKQQAGFLRFLMLTGLRRGEALGIEWDCLNTRACTLHLPETKNDDALTIPLSRQALEILQGLRDRPKPFPWVEVKSFVAKANEASGVAFSCHDLRRSFITYGVTCGVNPYAIKALVNHRTNAAAQDVTAGYVALTTDALREPAQHVADYIDARLASDEGKVVAIR
jgi:integrase